MLSGIPRHVRRLAQFTLGEFLRLTPVPARLFRVRGDSMRPTLAPDDCVFVVSKRAVVGSIVVAREPGHPERVLVKRVASRGTATVSLKSDNPLEGRDSRHFGSVPDELIIGTVCHIWRA